MAFDKDAFLSAMDSMTVMELNDLVKAIEEKFGVSAAAMAAPAAGGAAAAESSAKPGPRAGGFAVFSDPTAENRFGRAPVQRRGCPPAAGSGLPPSYRAQGPSSQSPVTRARHGQARPADTE